MKKRDTRIATVLMLLVVIGGWFLMDQLLRAKENRILSQTGQVAISYSAMDDKSERTGKAGTKEMSDDFRGQVLSEEEIARVLSAWEVGGKSIPQEPLTGQMNMEQAIEKGCQWIANLVERKVLPDEMLGNFDNTTAILYTMERETDIEPHMLSMWEITYKKQDVEIVMKIHAWSGEIWMASITMDQKPAVEDVYWGETLLDAVSSAFSWKSEEISAHLGHGIYYGKGKNENVYILLQRYEEISGNPYFGFCLWLASKEEGERIITN